MHDAKPALSVCACACMLVINKVLHAQNKALKTGPVNVATEQLQWSQKPEELNVNASLFYNVSLHVFLFHSSVTFVTGVL